MAIAACSVQGMLKRTGGCRNASTHHCMLDSLQALRVPSDANCGLERRLRTSLGPEVTERTSLMLLRQLLQHLAADRSAASVCCAHTYVRFLTSAVRWLQVPSPSWLRTRMHNCRCTRPGGGL